MEAQGGEAGAPGGGTKPGAAVVSRDTADSKTAVASRGRESGNTSEATGEPAAGPAATIVQTAYFAPKGLLGLLYWYSLYPIHGLIFGGMIREIARRAEAPVPER